MGTSLLADGSIKFRAKFRIMLEMPERQHPLQIDPQPHANTALADWLLQPSSVEESTHKLPLPAGITYRTCSPPTLGASPLQVVDPE